jgi:AraC-like DNA-binding protein
MGKRTAPLHPGEPLRRFNVLRARDPDELRSRLAPLYAVSKLDLPRSRFQFDAVLNHHQLRELALSYARYGAPVQMTMTNTDFYTQGFGVRGYGEAISDGRLFKIAAGQGGVAGPGATALLDYRANFEHVFLKIPPEALNRKLAALLGNPPGTPLKLKGEYDQAALAAQYRFLCFVISEIDRSPGGVPQLLLDEFEEALIVAYLLANLNNYTDRLNAKAPAVSPWQVERAIGYIEANWERPLTVEALAAATGTSARSLFATFRKSRGCSPMAFVRHVRLLRAREILSQPAPDTTVTSVAARCGFNNQSHFAKKYVACFGELPSETLKHAKSATESREL